MKMKFEKKRFIISAQTVAIELKDFVKKHFEDKGYEVIDVGANSEKPMTYIEAGSNAARAVKDGVAEFAIVMCGSGMGVCMAANRFPGIHCAICESIYTAKLARSINNANILAIGANIIAPKLATLMIEEFINTPFLDGFSENAKESLIKNYQMLDIIEKEAIQEYVK